MIQLCGQWGWEDAAIKAAGKELRQYVHQEGTFADVGAFTGTALEEVVDFWQDTNTKLGHVARALLSIPPSAAAPEVFFSLLGRPHVKGRAGMSTCSAQAA